MNISKKAEVVRYMKKRKSGVTSEEVGREVYKCTPSMDRFFSVCEVFAELINDGKIRKVGIRDGYFVWRLNLED